MSGTHDLPLVGPGNELQLTIDGRAVPHHEVVAARSARLQPAAAPGADAGAATAGGVVPRVAPGQTSLSAD
ncbi:hypothetical protein DSM112329_02544 [Paraconexibacter sp. AEG42_29]|uniref:Uncharacterized protein n=1 Tax=Paraconexibacter sp. AEG42_29 TaxID=2997339 RepID=A0AAU7AVL9_9ACTN